MTTKIGKLIYDHSEVLGQGNGTTVFSGIFRESFFGSDNPVAVNRILKNDVSLREVEIMQKLTGHPNIVRLFHVEKKDDFL